MSQKMIFLCFVLFYPLEASCPSQRRELSDPGERLTEELLEQRRGTGRLVPDTLDLQDNALLAIHAITRGMDPDLEYRLWFSIYFDRKPMVMRHHQLSEFDQAGKYLEGLTLMRLMTGSILNLERDKKLWEFLERHTGSDGLIYYGAGPTTDDPAYAYTQARSLLARICLYEVEPTPLLKQKIERMIDTMLKRKMTRGFGFGPLLPAIRWYQLTEYPNALKLAELDFKALEDGQFFAEDGSFRGHFHYHTGAAIGLLAFGLVTKNQPLLEKVRQIYEFARSKGTHYGFFPEALPPSPWVMQICNEGCCTADMVSLAATLSRSNVADYWDDLDRYLRNQLTEIQMKHTSFVGRIPPVNRVAIPVAPERGETELDDLTRFVGSFAGWAAPNDFAGPAHFWLQQCCLGNCPRALYQGWESIVTPTSSGFRINLLLNRSTPELEIDSYLPFQGKVDILVKKESRLEVRIPAWAKDSGVSARVDDHPIPLVWQGRYVDLDVVHAGSRIVVEFPVASWHADYDLPGPPWSSSYSVVDVNSGSGMPLPESIARTPPEVVARILEPIRYRVRYHGNAVVDIQPSGTIYPLYQRSDWLSSRTPQAKVRRHIPDKLVENWY